MARYWRRWRKRPRYGRRARFRSWRRFHRWGHRRRRYWRRWRHFRPRTAAVRYTPAKRHKILVVSGYEPLGNVCSTTRAMDEAKPYRVLDVPDMDQKVKTTAQAMKRNGNGSTEWSGTWGHHFFSFRQLVTRAQYYFANFSTDWRTYDYLQYLGGRIWLPRQMFFDWIFYIDYDLQDKTITPEDMDKYKNSKTWFHPGILINRKGAKLVGSPHRFGLKTMFRKVYLRPPASWEGLFNLPSAMDYIFVHWAWTGIDLEQSFMDSDAVKHITKDQIETVKPCEGVPWFWGGIESKQPAADGYDPRAAWVDREKYNCKDRRNYTGVMDSFARWGPFNPYTYGFPYGQSRSLWFKYRFYFKLSGDSVYRRPPTEGSEDLIPKAPGEKKNDRPRDEVPPRSILKRPLTPSDILPGDLDPDGILKDDALRRIVSSHRTGQPTMLVPKRVRFRIGRRDRQRKIHSLIRWVLGE
uniref:Capsid protein n=1 Tax=Torque teno Leptonychotes weddellii virus-2 TaxID=2012677 RepID=A0A1Z2RVZ2_9VIRU|nr:ORF1 [Torque teno Leptonychotes weddellii virus-2]